MVSMLASDTKGYFLHLCVPRGAMKKPQKFLKKEVSIILSIFVTPSRGSDILPVIRKVQETM